MTSVTSLYPSWTLDRPAPARPQPGAAAEPALASASKVDVSPEERDPADDDFDFAQAQRTAAAILRRDLYQMMLAEQSDSDGGVSYGEAQSAYREFGE